MIPTELISMGAGSFVGFLFKYMAERAKERAEIFKMSLDKQKANEEAHNAAAQRVSIDGGKWVRRMIVVAVLFGVIIAPFVLSLLNEPIFVQIDVEKPTWLFGLFGGGTKSEFFQVDGYLMIPEVRQTLTALIGFYFGSSAGKS